MLGAAMVANPSVRAMLEHHALLYDDLADPVPLFAGERGPGALAGLWPYAATNRPRGLEEADVARYSALMAESQAMVAEQVLEACPLGDVRTLLDIGGGSGAFAMAAAARWPGLRITVADLPAVASLARGRVEEAGLSARIAVVAADAVTDVLPGGFDVVSLIRILHDHDDARVLELLSAARRALGPGGLLLVAEPMSDAPGAGPLIESYFSVYLLAMGSGRPRTSGEIGRLLRRSGFRDFRRRRTGLPLVASVVTARVAAQV
jgi:demethylspheroidene O-methyltransferase